ncbi:hypothetical protein JCM8202_004071 [Rhodotorula sphaerocarpa]
MADSASYNGSNGVQGRGRGRGGRGGSSSRGRGGAGGSRAQTTEAGAVPAGSVSKLKAQIRQTKRLLARDDVTPDLRATTERRMVALESELAKTSQSKVEKKMVQRYRGVKFFERQKLLRKIKQAKKQLADVPESADAQRALFDARADLYYVLRYPKTEKYIALFPDGTYVPPIPSLTALAADAPHSERKRQTLRIALRDQMRNGELAEEAELGELGIEGEEDVASGPTERKRGRPEGVEADEEEGREEAAEPDAGVALEPAEEEEQRPTKRSRSTPSTETAAAANTPEAGAPPATKKEKENRKQRKERKRAEAEAGGAAGGAVKVEEAPTRTEAGSGAAKKKGGKKAARDDGTDAGGLAAQDDFFA